MVICANLYLYCTKEIKCHITWQIVPFLKRERFSKVCYIFATCNLLRGSIEICKKRMTEGAVGRKRYQLYHPQEKPAAHPLTDYLNLWFYQKANMLCSSFLPHQIHLLMHTYKQTHERGWDSDTVGCYSVKCEGQQLFLKLNWGNLLCIFKQTLLQLIYNEWAGHTPDTTYCVCIHSVTVFTWLHIWENVFSMCAPNLHLRVLQTLMNL